MKVNKLPVLPCTIIILTLLMGVVVACKQQDSPVPSVPSSQIPASDIESQPEPEPAPSSEPEIPAHYTTYTSEEDLFSISYPPDWEIYTSRFEDVEKAIAEVISDSDMNASMENALQKASIIFLAGLPTEQGYDPNMNIVVEPVPLFYRTQDKMVEANITNMEKICPDYYMHSRTNTVVDGKEATIIESEATITSEKIKTFNINVTILSGKVCWYVTCGTTNLNAYEEYKDDFHHIIRSLRIYK